ncbi:hypothetical protein AALD74_10115 [Lachnospiraceae bacterium 48-21]
MELGESVYEFVDKFAYVACAANIVLENYTMTDGEDVYQKLMEAFKKYIEYYNQVKPGGGQGEVSRDAADAVLKSYINWLRNECITRFMEKIQLCINEEFSEKACQDEVKERLEGLQREMKDSDFSTFDFLGLLIGLRSVEEKVVG